MSMFLVGFKGVPSLLEMFVSFFQGAKKQMEATDDLVSLIWSMFNQGSKR